MSGGSGTTWLSLLDDKKSQLTERCETSSTIISEATFRTAFEGICRKYREHWGTRLLANLLRSFGHITVFTSAIGAAAQHVSPDGLTELVWAASFAAIEGGCKTGTKLDGLVELVGGLNRSVPQLGLHVARYPNDASVQTPLQDLLSTYLDSYLFMISCFNEDSPSVATHLIKNHIEEISKKFEDARSTYEEMLDLAQQNEAQERLRIQQASLERQHGVPNGIHEGNINPYYTQARFSFRRRLGSGSFGEVAEVEEMSTGQVYARKLIHYDESSPKKAGIEKDVLNEVQIMQKLRHQHIASVLFFVKEPGSYSILMLPVADSDLLCYLERCANKDYPVSSVKRIYSWFGCLLDAIAYAHKLNIKHRDIKPSNILIKDSQPYLADFGVAKDFTIQDMSASGDYFVKGTPVYRAPETRPDNQRGRPADIFALGCVFSEMLTVSKRKSLDEFRHWRQTSENNSGVFAFRANLPKVREWLVKLEPDVLSALLVEQTLSMLHEDPEERPTAQDSVHYLKRERALFCASH